MLNVSLCVTNMVVSSLSQRAGEEMVVGERYSYHQRATGRTIPRQQHREKTPTRSPMSPTTSLMSHRPLTWESKHELLEVNSRETHAITLHHRGSCLAAINSCVMGLISNYCCASRVEWVLGAKLTSGTIFLRERCRVEKPLLSWSNWSSCRILRRDISAQLEPARTKKQTNAHHAGSDMASCYNEHRQSLLTACRLYCAKLEIRKAKCMLRNRSTSSRKTQHTRSTG